MHKQVSTGLEGLDSILYGGLPKGAAVIVEGTPGTGKTTLGMQFLREGILHEGEAGMFITFEEFPEQIYADMNASFGWDLRSLEQKNKLRVVGLSPEILVEHMQAPEGLLEQMIKEIDCQRIVIDSISMLNYLSGTDELEQRRTLYKLRNVLRKFGMTSLLLQERSQLTSNHVPFSNFIADGVVSMSVTPQSGVYRKRTMEVLKMRGSPIIEGEHPYKITGSGICVIVSARPISASGGGKNSNLKTGIPGLDQILGGGMMRGAIHMLDTNSKANYIPLIGSILAERVKAGNKILSVLSSTQTIFDFTNLLNRHEVDYTKVVNSGKILFIEHYRRAIPEGWEKAVFYVDHLDNKEYDQFLKEHCFPLLKERGEGSAEWFVYYDLNTIINERGADYVLRSFAKEAAMARSLGMTVLVLCNFKEVGEQVASFLERTANDVLKTWVDGSSQYLQVTKASNGPLSEPYLIESTNEHPFIRLI